MKVVNKIKKGLKTDTFLVWRGTAPVGVWITTIGREFDNNTGHVGIGVFILLDNTICYNCCWRHRVGRRFFSFKFIISTSARPRWPIVRTYATNEQQ